MDTQDREKYRQLRQQQRERQLHIIRLSILLGVGVILMFTGLGLLTYVHQQKQTATSGNVSERFSEAASSAALETASRNDLDTETAAATEKAQKKKKSSPRQRMYLRQPLFLRMIILSAAAAVCGSAQIKKDLKRSFPLSEIAAESTFQNSEMLVLCWIIRKNIKMPLPKAFGDDFVTGEIPALIQWDERWGYAPYGSETIIAVSGCGPTALSMVISGLLRMLPLRLPSLQIMQVPMAIWMKIWTLNGN